MDAAITKAGTVRLWCSRCNVGLATTKTAPREAFKLARRQGWRVFEAWWVLARTRALCPRCR